MVNKGILRTDVMYFVTNDLDRLENAKGKFSISLLFLYKVKATKRFLAGLSFTTRNSYAHKNFSTEKVSACSSHSQNSCCRVGCIKDN